MQRTRLQQLSQVRKQCRQAQSDERFMEALQAELGQVLQMLQAQEQQLLQQDSQPVTDRATDTKGDASPDADASIFVEAAMDHSGGAGDKSFVEELDSSSGSAKELAPEGFEEMALPVDDLCFTTEEEYEDSETDEENCPYGAPSAGRPVRTLQQARNAGATAATPPSDSENASKLAGTVEQKHDGIEEPPAKRRTVVHSDKTS
mmetsp:Transcript_19811/g.46064  ORF Transcript_19811/g.46064 Transcript_19811/m.46064 type:complete len:204 (-) Transcript_19811:38-649(-)